MTKVQARTEDLLLAVLLEIHLYQQRRKFPPAIRDLVGFKKTGKPAPTSVINRYLDLLTGRGWLSRDVKISRSLVVTRKGLDALGIFPVEHRCPSCGKTVAPIVLEALFTSRTQ